MAATQNLHLPVFTGEMTRPARAQEDGTLVGSFRSIRGEDFELIVTAQNLTRSLDILAEAAALKVSGIATTESGTRTIRADIRHIVALSLD